VAPAVELPSRAQDGIEAVVESLSEAMARAIEGLSEPPAAAGLAIPGHADDASGIVRWAPNFGRTVDGVFHYWKDVPIKALLRGRFDFPVHMGNDANLAALGEFRFGTGENRARCLVMITLGTGVGGGVVLSPSSVLGRAQGPLVLLGGNLGGAELGHLALLQGGLDCNAGSYGSLEAYCQRDSIVRRAQHRLRRGRESLILELVEGDVARVTPKLLTEAADRGDEVAIEVWEEVGAHLGVGIGSCINVFAPDILAIGGQIAKAGRWLLEPAIRSARNVAIPSLFSDARIVQAACVEDAGMLGGAALALEALQWKSNGS
jgi:glucokinase